MPNNNKGLRMSAKKTVQQRILDLPEVKNRMPLLAADIAREVRLDTPNVRDALFKMVEVGMMSKSVMADSNHIKYTLSPGKNPLITRSWK